MRILLLSFLAFPSFLTAQNLNAKAESPLAVKEVSNVEYAEMLSESFLGSDAPILKQAATPLPSQQKANIQKSDWVSDDAGDFKETKGRGESLIREITIVDVPGFPKFYDTGNPELDKSTFDKAREQWATLHPEAYKELSQTFSF